MSEQKTVKQRPVTMKIEGFRQSLNKAVAESELPPFMLELLIGEYLSGIRMVAQQEYAQDREEWKKEEGV